MGLWLMAELYDLGLRSVVVLNGNGFGFGYEYGGYGFGLG